MAAEDTIAELEALLAKNRLVVLKYVCDRYLSEGLKRKLIYCTKCCMIAPALRKGGTCVQCNESRCAECAADGGPRLRWTLCPLCGEHVCEDCLPHTDCVLACGCAQTAHRADHDCPHNAAEAACLRSFEGLCRRDPGEVLKYICAYFIEHDDQIIACGWCAEITKVLTVRRCRLCKNAACDSCVGPAHIIRPCLGCQEWFCRTCREWDEAYCTEDCEPRDVDDSEDEAADAEAKRDAVAGAPP